MSDTLFIDLLISRLVHDLASPLGAINNGLELAEEEQNAAFREEALSLVKRSAKRANDLLGFLRMAYGAAGRSANFSGSDAIMLGRAWLNDARLQLETLEDIPNNQARLLLHLILVAFETMPRGGKIIAKAGPLLIMEGQRGGMLSDLQSFIRKEEITLTARNIILHHAQKEAQNLNKQLIFVEENNTIARLGCM